MGNESGIEWTDATWNPTTGCTKISEGCRFCYAAIMTDRQVEFINQRQQKALAEGKSFDWSKQKYRNGFLITTHSDPKYLEQPLRWQKPRLIFVDSMSDLFHSLVPVSFIKDVWDVMLRADWHTYQILTKRSERLTEINDQVEWTNYIWMGVSVESQRYKYRIDDLIKTDAKVKWLSVEPHIGRLDIADYLATGDIHWVVVGGESGFSNKIRPLSPEWVRLLRDQCEEYKVPFFFKQWGGRNKKEAGCSLDGVEIKEYPLLVVA